MQMKLNLAGKKSAQNIDRELRRNCFWIVKRLIEKLNIDIYLTIQLCVQSVVFLLIECIICIR
jgi:hypothetical protein